jgi:hypothetical protein
VHAVSYDSSRFTFDPRNDFEGVVMEQGRPLLDSDWNEWLDELRRREQAETFDIVGPAGYPTSTPHAFEILVPTTPTARNGFTIGAGRMYVDGLLAENHGSSDADKVQWDPALAEQSGSPDAPIDYVKQPYQPFLTDAELPPGAGPYMVYLDVWRREITYLEHPEIVESALGFDTTGRWQTVWQVKVLDASQLGGRATCAAFIPAWADLIKPAEERLTTDVVSSSPSGPCCLTATTGYTGRESQLYRLEIQQAGAALTAPATPIPFPIGNKIATFKWSRDNASVATNISAITAVNVAGVAASLLTVDSTGKDDVLRFSVNDWVETTDDWRELRGQPGELRRVVGVDDTSKTVTVSPQLTTAKFLNVSGQIDRGRHARLIRWDQKGLVLEKDGKTVWVNLDDPNSTGEIPVPSPGISLILEDGIIVSFDGASFRSGNYWCFAARSTDGSLEKLSKSPPRGIHHHYTRLAVVTFGGAQNLSTATDCRRSFPPITEDPGIHVTQIYRLNKDGGRIPMGNDAILTLDEFTNGLDIECDQAIDPRSLSRPTCFVSIEVPLPVPNNELRTFPQFTLVAVPGRQTIILDAVVDLDPTGKVIRWRPTPASIALLRIVGPKEFPDAQGILTRLTLVGNFIWSAADPTIYLDGDAFAKGSSIPLLTGIGLLLPSGDGRRGGTFSMWFWLALVKGVSISTAGPFTPGKVLDGIVEVTISPRPPNPFLLNLAIEGTALPGITITPTTVEIKTGTKASFQITSTPNSLGQFMLVASLGSDQQACNVKISGA